MAAIFSRPSIAWFLVPKSSINNRLDPGHFFMLRDNSLRVGAATDFSICVAQEMFASFPKLFQNRNAFVQSAFLYQSSRVVLLRSVIIWIRFKGATRDRKHFIVATIDKKNKCCFIHDCDRQRIQFKGRM